MGLAGLHLFLFRKAGPAGPFPGHVEEIKAKTDYFFPRQIWKDIVGMVAVFRVSVASRSGSRLCPRRGHAGSRRLPPGTEWYFLFLFQPLRLKVFAGEFGQFLGAIALPGAFMALLAALPFI